MKPMAACQYWGGKAQTGRGTGRWIASMLPYRTRYYEPFCGMLGVLLGRAKSTYEIANDADGRIIDWWLTLRDHPDEFAHRVQWTPNSRRLFEKAYRELASPDRMTRALAVQVILMQSLHSGLGTKSWWTITANHRRSKADILRLYDRIKDVAFDDADACDVLERSAKRDDAVVYCDPPYSDMENEPYAVDVDRGRLGELLLAQKGFVAISGYGTEWDHLGWVRRETRSWTQMTGMNPDGSQQARTEVLWLNAEPPAPGFLAGVE